MYSGTSSYDSVKQFNELYINPTQQHKLSINADYVPSQRTGQTATYDAGGTCDMSTGNKRKEHCNSVTGGPGHKEHTSSLTGEPGHKKRKKETTPRGPQCKIKI